MSQSGTEPEIDSCVHSPIQDTVTVTPQPETAPMALVSDDISDKDRVSPSEFGFFDQEMNSEHPEGYAACLVSTGAQVYHQSSVEKRISNSDCQCFEDVWTPIPLYLSPSLPPGDLPFSLPEVPQGETSMCVHGAQPFHAETPNAEALWGQNWLEEHQKSLKNAFLGLPTQNMKIPSLSVPKVIFDPPPRGPNYRWFPKCGNGGPGTPLGPEIATEAENAQVMGRNPPCWWV